jgi:hypothetical protein
MEVLNSARKFNTKNYYVSMHELFYTILYCRNRDETLEIILSKN